MSTFILKTQTTKAKNDCIFRIESYREKPLLLLEENLPNPRLQDELKSKHLHLPQIYQTENLLPNRLKARNCFDKENDFSVPKLFKKKAEHRVRAQVPRRTATDERDKLDLTTQRIYHNFVSKKLNRQRMHMSKIIEKVISEDIEPWGESSKGKRHPQQLYRDHQYLYDFAFCREDSQEAFPRGSIIPKHQ